MDEEALIDAHTLFSGNGYNGSIEAFKTLISTNDDALQDAHILFSEKGYTGDLQAFSTLVGIKKKVPTTFTVSELGLEEGPLPSDTLETDGVSDLAEAENPTGFSALPEQIVNIPVAELYDQYEQAGLITTGQERNIEAEIARKEKGEFSWWESLNAYADGLLRMGIAVPLYQFDSKEDLLEQRAVKNRIDFLQGLPDEKVKELNAFAVRKHGELSKESMNVLAENSILMEKSRLIVNNIKNVEDTIKKIQASGEQAPIEGVKYYHDLINQLKGISTTYNQNVDILENNQDDIGTFQEELEFLKKNYGGLEYYKDVMRLSSADMIAGISEFTSSTMKMSPQHILGGLELEQFNKQFREEITRQREFQKPMMSVSEINNASDFGKWLAEQTASQIPVLTVLAAGGSTI